MKKLKTYVELFENIIFDDIHCCSCKNPNILLYIDVNSGPLNLTTLSSKLFMELYDEQKDFCEEIGYDSGDAFELTVSDIKRMLDIRDKLEKKYNYLSLGKLEFLWSCGNCESDEERACTSKGSIRVDDFLNDPILFKKLIAKRFNL